MWDDTSDLDGSKHRSGTVGASRSPSNVGEVVVVVVGETQSEEAADRIAVRGLRMGVLSAFFFHVVLEGVALGLLQEGETCSKIIGAH